MKIWNFLKDENNRGALGIVGAIAAFLVAGFWTVFVYMDGKKHSAQFDDALVFETPSLNEYSDSDIKNNPLSNQSKEIKVGPDESLLLEKLNIVIYYQNDVTRTAVEIEKKLRSLGAIVHKTIGGPRADKRRILYTSENDAEYAILLSSVLKDYGFSDVTLTSVFDRSFDEEGRIPMYFYVNKYTVGLLE